MKKATKRGHQRGGGIKEEAPKRRNQREGIIVEEASIRRRYHQKGGIIKEKQH